MKPLSLRHTLLGIFLLGVVFVGGMASYLSVSLVTSSRAAIEGSEELVRSLEAPPVPGAELEQALARLSDAVESGRRLRNLTILWALVGVLLAGAALVWFSVRVYGPLREVEKGLARMGAGEYDRPVPVAHHDELGRLAEILNSATSRLRQRREAQARVTRSLMERVGHLMEDSAREIYILHGDDLSVVQMNRTLRRNLGWEDAALGDLTLFDFLSQADGEDLKKGLVRLTAGEVSLLPFRVRHLRKDGSGYPVEGHIQYSGEEEPPVFLAVARDMTEIYDREDRLRQAMKMQAVGQLTGGVAHDFNNLLTVIQGSLDLLEDSLPPNDMHLVLLKDAIAAAERGGALTHQLLAFSRKQALRPQTLDLNQLVSEMEPMLGRTLGEEVGLLCTGTPDLWRCHADPTEVQNVILNLCLNARDAMPWGGGLVIETTNSRLDEKDAAALDELRPGHYVLVSVADTGQGMSPEVLSRAFDPFFTTKEFGQGSGLGLSMAFGFAKQSGGHIHISSEEGKGTTVRLYLPRLLAEQMDLGVLDEATASGIVGGSGERVLVVEDDEGVLATVTLTFDTLGYETRSATDADSALGILRAEPPGSFSLLFTDVVLPGGKSGGDLAREAREHDPDLPVLFTSGYTENSNIDGGRLEPGVHLLRKPYGVQELARKVREVMG